MPSRCLTVISILAVVCVHAPAVEAQLTPFKDSETRLWGYEAPDGTVVIDPIYFGAGEFRDGLAPIEDNEGLGLIDEDGATVARTAKSSLPSGIEPVPAPSDECAWSESDPFPSKGLDCYVAQLSGPEPIARWRVVREEARPEGGFSVSFLQLEVGAVFIEYSGYENRDRVLLLPGITAEEAARWQQALYPNRRVSPGCSENWISRAIEGGALIQQSWGC